MMTSQRTQNCLIERTAVSSRIIMARLNSYFKKTTIIELYASTNRATDHEKDEFYEQPQVQVEKCNRHQFKCITINSKYACISHNVVYKVLAVEYKNGGIIGGEHARG